MRLTAYAGASTALAAGVIIYAFNQRANFYSACVYLSQSNLCLMILTNLILLIIASFMFGLQRIFYGPLRPIEIEQLYEKAWFAVTETCLAMTIFREEVGAWFLVMFVALLAGKVWGWIGEGRVEVLEQQPPENPRLVHTRLSLSLALSLAYDMYILGYTIHTVIQQARPNMMVMFLFEFAVLTTSSFSTALRYCISLIESRITKQQTLERLEWRRREVREEREEILRQRAATVAASTETADNTETVPELPPLPSEDDVDEMDIEVPGWEAKGQWVLTLDLMTDFVKLGIYITFFFILLTFYGLPIHIMRDLFLTARSFIMRLTAFLRYRKATHEMNERYPDATVEEIQREDTCIICREEMRPWSVTNPAEPPALPANGIPAANGPAQPPQARRRPSPTVNERSRPKKLTCGHVLHLGCLKSWLERQQVCPTCRRPVVDNRNPQGHAQQPGQGAAGQAAGRGQAAGAGAGMQANGQPPPVNNNVRMIEFGPFRFAFGQANNIQDFAQQVPDAQQNQQNPAPGGPRLYGLELGFPRHQPPPPQRTSVAGNRSANSTEAQLLQIEQQIMHDLVQLRLNQDELAAIQRLQAHIAQLRSRRAVNINASPTGQLPPIPQVALAPNSMARPGASTAVPRLQQHVAVPGTSVIPSGSNDLPPGLTIPEGWTLLPLQRLDRAAPTINGVLSHLAGSQPIASNAVRVSESATAPAQSLPTSGAFANETANVPLNASILSTVNSANQGGVLLGEEPTDRNNGRTSSTDEIELSVPDWGAAQQYGSSSTGNTFNDSSLTSALSVLPEASQTTNLAVDEATSSTPTANGSSISPGVEETPNSIRKGKAKAATVEDSTDDA